MKSIDDALELRGRIFGAFELAELAQHAGRGRAAADLRRRRRRADGRRDGRADRRAAPTAPCATTSAGSTPPRRGSSSSTRSTRCCPPSASGSATRPAGGSPTWGSTCAWAPRSPTSTPPASPSPDADGARPAIEALTKVWAAGVQASPLGRQIAEQSGAGVDRAGRVAGAARPHRARPPRGVRRRRHDGARRAPGRGPGRHPGRAVRRASRSRAGSTGKPPQARVRVLRQGLDGHDLAVQRGGLDRPAALLRASSPGCSGSPIHLVYIIGFKHRVTTLLHWAVSFLGRGRSERVATEQQVFGRARHRASCRERRAALHPHRPGRRRGRGWPSSRRAAAPLRRERRPPEVPADRRRATGRRVTAMPLDYPIHRRTLPNGLRVVVSPDHTVPNVTVNIWVGVGLAPRDGRPHRVRPPLRAPDVPGLAQRAQR